LKLLALLLGTVVSWEVLAQERVTVQTRPGVTLAFFVANLGGRKPEAVALLLAGGVRQSVLAGFNWSKVKMPLLLVHPEDDGCATPYFEAERLARRFPPFSKDIR
jgi:hypothetical protein